MQRGGGGRLGRGESVVTRKQLQTHVSDARVPFDAPPRSVLATLRLSILISRHASSLSKSAEGFQASLGIMLALFFLSDLEFIHRLAKVGLGMRFFPFWCSDFQGWFREIFLCDFLCFGFGIGFCLFCFVRVLVKVKSRYWVLYSLIFAFITCGAFSRLPNGDWSVFLRYCDGNYSLEWRNWILTAEEIWFYVNTWRKHAF